MNNSLFTLTNQDRASAGLNALVNDPYLHKEAEWRAQDMGVRDYFSHQIPPDNKMVFDYMTADGYCFKVAGENIAVSTYGDDVATANIEVGFMGSPTHRENILGTWADMGVGAYKAADGKKYYAVLFSIPCSATAATPVPSRKPTPKPTPKPTAKPLVTALPTDTPLNGPTPSASDLPTPAPSPTPSTSPMPAPTTVVPSPLPLERTEPVRGSRDPNVGRADQPAGLPAARLSGVHRLVLQLVLQLAIRRPVRLVAPENPAVSLHV